MRKWLGRWVALLIGWRLTMAYPMDDSFEQWAISLVIGTVGCAWIAATCYWAGRADAALAAADGREG